MAALLALPEGGEWIVLLVIVVFLFGANKLPALTRNAAKALIEFRKITDKADEPAEVERTQAAREQDRPAGADEPQEIREQDKPQV
jgi:sec-independent protein translocase protein TatA